MERSVLRESGGICVSPDDIDTLVSRVNDASCVAASSDQTALVAKQHRASLQFYGAVCPLPLRHSVGLELFESPAVQGRGVRSRVAIPPNCCITHYPCHAIGDRFELYITDEARCSTQFIDNLPLYAVTHGFTIPAVESVVEGVIGDATGKLAMPPSFEQMIVNDAWRCIGDPHSGTESQLLLGHMINDARGNIFAACPDDVTQLRNLDFRNIVMAYLINGMRNNNCRFSVNKTRTCVTVVSTRLITPSEELFVPYGAYYWFLARYAGDRSEVPHRIYDEGKRLFDALYSDNDFIKWQEQCQLVEKTAVC